MTWYSFIEGFQEGLKVNVVSGFQIDGLQRTQEALASLYSTTVQIFQELANIR